MTQFIFNMPDLGEGTVEAEIVAWHTQPGAVVKEDQIIVEVMTDKAAVEVPAPVGGRVVSISGEPGDKVAVGAPLIVFDVSATEGSPETPPPTAAAGGDAAPAAAAGKAAPAVIAGTAAPAAAAAAPAAARVTATVDGAARSDRSVADPDGAPRSGRVKASPADRRRAREAGIDLQTVVGSGPGGRILRGDLAAAGAPGTAAAPGAATSPLDGASPPPGSSWPASPGAPAPATAQTTDIKIIGVRRIIAERMSEAKRTIPHFAYVEEVDVTELETLRLHLNAGNPGAPGLTYLPLVVMALTRALESFPQCNVVHDAARGVLVRHAAVHVGIATQTPDGLKVPVVHNAQALSVWTLAAAIRRVAERARTNQATRDELKGSTITVTSLGKLGGIASTPVINAPEVAIIGLNKAALRPVVQGGAVVVRLIMNLSSSFDHRFVDGYDAASMIQALKDLLEHPATIFIPKVESL
jgi:2-oxoisovalerate dehydrogenase E2 component (dihydrolipoyl transacylase)